MRLKTVYHKRFWTQFFLVLGIDGIALNQGLSSVHQEQKKRPEICIRPSIWKMMKIGEPSSTLHEQCGKLHQKYIQWFTWSMYQFNATKYNGDWDELKSPCPMCWICIPNAQNTIGRACNNSPRQCVLRLEMPTKPTTNCLPLCSNFSSKPYRNDNIWRSLP